MNGSCTVEDELFGAYTPPAYSARASINYQPQCDGHRIPGPFVYEILGKTTQPELLMVEDGAS